MLRNSRDLEGFELRARDGRIGHVTDFLFDDRLWGIRYLVVDTGSWLSHREVLIAPASVGAPDWASRQLPVDLTTEQVRRSPSVDTQRPLTREQEMRVIQYYSWPMYWGGATGFPDGLLLTTPAYLPGDAPGAQRRSARLGPALDEQHHIRSMADVRGYQLEANDGGIGHIDAFVIDVGSWAVAYVIVDTRNWLPGRRVLISPEWIFEVGWDEAKVFVDVSREAVRCSPEFDPAAPLTTEYADRLHAHYGQPRRSLEP